MLRYGLLAVAGLALTVQTASANELTETLLARKSAVTDAMKQNDAQAFLDLLSDQEFSITTNSGRLPGLEVQKAFDAKQLTSYDLSDVELVDVDENVKILTFKYTWSGTTKGQLVEDESVYGTVVYANRDGQWKSIFYQETPIMG